MTALTTNSDGSVSVFYKHRAKVYHALVFLVVPILVALLGAAIDQVTGVIAYVVALLILICLAMRSVTTEILVYKGKGLKIVGPKGSIIKVPLNEIKSIDVEVMDNPLTAMLVISGLNRIVIGLDTTKRTKIARSQILDNLLERATDF